MENKKLLLEAIDNYSLFNKNQKKVLQALLNLSIDGEVIASIKDLLDITKLTRATISSALSFLEAQEFIEIPSLRGVVFTSCKIKQSKLTEIVTSYQTKIKLINSN